MQDLNDLYYFVQVVDNGGFAAAGRAIGMQKSLLSRRILQLEDRLGARLLNRSSRQFSVTEIGREYYNRCVAMLVEVEAADQVIAQIQGAPRGIIRVSCPVSLVSFQFGALFAKFLAAYPAVEMQLESTNRRVDLIAEGLDVAIRVRFPPLGPSDLVMRQLDLSTQCLVASPDFLESRSIRSPADLSGLSSMSLNLPQQIRQWDLEQANGQRASVPHRPRLVTDDMLALREAAEAGVGIVQLPTMMVWQQIENGKLVPVISDWRPPAGVVHAIFPSRRSLLPAVRALLDFLAAECALARKMASFS